MPRSSTKTRVTAKSNGDSAETSSCSVNTKQQRQRENDQWREDAAGLSYEESLQAADLLLNQLQNDAIPLAELDRAHRRGQIYLEHCRSLLNQLEQTVQELDSETMTTSDRDTSAT